MSTQEHGVSQQVELEVLVSNDNEIYVKFSGFESAADADAYAAYLAENLSLLLFESKVMH